MFLLLQNVSPISAISTERLLKLEGWNVEVRPTEWTGIPRRAV
jgi:hypothetical protein